MLAESLDEKFLLKHRLHRQGFLNGCLPSVHTASALAYEFCEAVAPQWRTESSRPIAQSLSCLFITACGLPGKYVRYKPGSCFPNLSRSVLLQKMGSLHSNLLLIRPGPAEFTLRTDQKSGWIPVYEQLRHRARGQPTRIGINDLANIFGLSFYRQFSRPGQHWLTRRAGVSIVTAINFDRLVGYAPERQKIFYEKILFEGSFLPPAGVRCALKKPRVDSGHSSQERNGRTIALHVNDCLDPLGMALRP